MAISNKKKYKKNALKKCNKIICAGREEISVLKNVFKISELNIEYMINPQNLSLFKNVKSKKHVKN